MTINDNLPDNIRLADNKYILPENQVSKNDKASKIGQNRIILTNGSELKQVEMRLDKPSFLTARKWAEVKVADQQGKEKTIYLNISSLADNLNISKGVIENQRNNLGSFLNQHLKDSPKAASVPVAKAPPPIIKTPGDVQSALKAKGSSVSESANITQDEGAAQAASDLESILFEAGEAANVLANVASNTQEEGDEADLDEDELLFKATQAVAKDATDEAANLEQILNEVSSSLPYDDYDQLANKANADGKSNVTAQDMRDALKYLAQPENQAKIQRMRETREGYGKEYIVLRKEVTGLKYNLEYYGPSKVYLRYHSDFASGATASGSRAVDLYNKQLLVKGKMILVLTNQTAAEALGGAQRYKEARAEFLKNPVKELYASKPTTLEQAKDKFTTGKGIEGVLQNESMVTYSKEVYSKEGDLIGKVSKVAIYSIMQEGRLTFANLRNGTEVKQAALGIVRNTASLNRAGFVHNDIKGENALFTRDAQGIHTKMIDLELSKPLTSVENYQSGTVFPPETFVTDISKLSPEQKEQYNKAKDAWALGEMLLLQIFGEKMPWLYINAYSNIQMIKNELAKMRDPTTIQNHLSQLTSVPPEYKHVITRLLDPNVQTRMTAEQAEAYLLANSSDQNIGST